MNYKIVLEGVFDCETRRKLKGKFKRKGLKVLDKFVKRSIFTIEDVNNYDLNDNFVYFGGLIELFTHTRKIDVEKLIGDRIPVIKNYVLHLNSNGYEIYVVETDLPNDLVNDLKKLDSFNYIKFFDSYESLLKHFGNGR